MTNIIEDIHKILGDISLGKGDISEEVTVNMNAKMRENQIEIEKKIEELENNINISPFI